MNGYWAAAKKNIPSGITLQAGSQYEAQETRLDILGANAHYEFFFTITLSLKALTPSVIDLPVVVALKMVVEMDVVTRSTITLARSFYV